MKIKLNRWLFSFLFLHTKEINIESNTFNKVKSKKQKKIIFWNGNKWIENVSVSVYISMPICRYEIYFNFFFSARNENQTENMNCHCVSIFLSLLLCCPLVFDVPIYNHVASVLFYFFFLRDLHKWIYLNIWNIALKIYHLFFSCSFALGIKQPFSLFVQLTMYKCVLFFFFFQKFLVLLMHFCCCCCCYSEWHTNSEIELCCR